MTAAAKTRPVSVVIPAHNVSRSIARCIEAVRKSAHDAEIIVVDDGSSDDTASIATTLGAMVVRHATAKGPAAARNAGARSATGAIVLFVDADILVAEDAVPRVVAAFMTDAGLTALFGSYDDALESRAFVSDYRNLLHHFVHQTSRADSQSFWAGCGAIRRAAFVAIGGFDERYVRPSIEDIELGDRLARGGHRVRLDRHVRGTHLKRWTLGAVVLVDIRDRAYPWARLILHRGRIPSDLNLRPAHRASAALVWLCAILAVHAALDNGRTVRIELVALATSGLCVLWLNRGFYRFLMEKRGIWFTLRAVPLHLFYYGYASATFAWCWVWHRAGGIASLARRATRPGAATGTSA